MWRLLMRAIAVFLFAVPFTYAADPTCTAVASVKKCVESIKSTKTRTASASSFCYSVLGCTTTPTTTLQGTVTATSTIVVVESYTFEELGTIYSETTTLTDTQTTSIPVFTTTVEPVFYVQKFLVTTVKAKRDSDSTLHPRDLEGRAAATPLQICPTSVQREACSCLVTCPTTVTKDKRKTIKEKTTETSYDITYTSIPYTETEYVAIPTTTTVPYTETSSATIYSTQTKTIKCTPNVANPSFYLKATNVPVDDINNKFIQAFPYYFAFQSQRKVAFVNGKDLASVFSLDSKSRLIVPSSDGTLYGQIDYFNDFEVFSFLTRELIQSRNYIYASCKLNPPSGLYAGGLQELTCSTVGTWPASQFYYDEPYNYFYEQPIVLAPPNSCPTRGDPETCHEIVFLVVPVCG